MHFVDTVDLTPQVIDYARQIQQQEQVAMAYMAQTQAAINVMKGSAQPVMGCRERNRDILSKDLDSWRTGQE